VSTIGQQLATRARGRRAPGSIAPSKIRSRGEAAAAVRPLTVLIGAL
jgi:hypothetical protein